MTNLNPDQIERFLKDSTDELLVEMFIRERLGLPPATDSGILPDCIPTPTATPDMVAKYRDSVLKRLGQIYPDHKFEFPLCRPSELFPDVTLPQE